MHNGGQGTRVHFDEQQIDLSEQQQFSEEAQDDVHAL